MENNIKVLVLAAGQGKRMGVEDLPKVLVPLKGKPMLRYITDAIKNSGVGDKPTVVIGKFAEKVKSAFGDEVDYVLQEEQLGTGHAVMVATYALKDASDVMVLYGDQPLVSPELIRNLANKHLSSDSVLTMATVTTPDFEEWRAEFERLGRILRNEKNEVIGMVEKKDATEEQAKIMEIWPGYICFKADWLWENLKKLGKNNAQGEYYLTDLVKMAVDQGYVIPTVNVSPKEGLGINTSEHLKSIEKLF